MKMNNIRRTILAAGLMWGVIGGIVTEAQIVKWPEKPEKPQVITWDDGTKLSDRKSTRLNSSHLGISYAVFCLKKKHKTKIQHSNVVHVVPRPRDATCDCIC